MVALAVSFALAEPAVSTSNAPVAQAAPTAPVVITFPNRDVFLSPYNWRVPGDGTVWAPSPGGPYFKFSVTGTTKVLLNVDTSINAGVAAGDMPTLKVFIDGVPMAFVQLGTSATQVTLASGLTTGTHTILAYAILGSGVKNNGWSATTGQMHIQSLQFDAGSTLSPYPTIYRKNCLIFGDSFLMSYFGEARSPNAPFYTVVDPTLSWAVQLGPAIGCEVGVIGIGGSGYLQPGGWGYPPLSEYWNQYDSTHARNFSPAPDYTINAVGINDHRIMNDHKKFSDSEVETAVRNWLAAARSALPSTKIFVFIPVGGEETDEDGTGGANATQIRDAVKASGDANVFLIDAGTQFVSADNWVSRTWFAPNDGIHPAEAGHSALAKIAIQQMRKVIRVEKPTPMAKAVAR
jgi:lysophospholipase L1-like esterase